MHHFGDLLSVFVLCFSVLMNNPLLKLREPPKPVCENFPTLSEQVGMILLLQLIDHCKAVRLEALDLAVISGDYQIYQ